MLAPRDTAIRRYSTSVMAKPPAAPPLERRFPKLKSVESSMNCFFISAPSISLLQFQEDFLQGFVSLDFLHGAGLDQAAVLDDGYLVAEFFCHLQHVG